MATLTEKTLLGGDGGQSLLPRSVSDEIWKLATEEAIVPSLAKAHPVILGENLVPVLTKRPAASIIGEGQNKVDSSLEVGAKAIKPIKAVVGLEFTMETVHKNPAGVLDMISSELSDSLSRQIDLAVLHGRQASDGKPLSGNPEFLAQTTKKVALSGKPEAVDKELWDGYNQVVGGDKPLGFNGFALDPRLVGQLANARDKEGRRTNPDIPMGGSVATYSGQSVRVSRSVSGQVDASADTNIRGFGGDWTALRFGRALDIGLKRIEYGDPFGNGDLQRRNSVAFMTEVIFGWGILDLDAFVKYEVASTTSGATS
ncbi:major capsid protein [Corynebacterium sp. HMSC072D12]|uniref:phage major capsid protein n=1 Tax=Corynebacterium sp. HMSC072D12 TaxID=1739447 RepID=UPI0008A52B65|nr:phage major capsid protein [Corynebacterium sp. HMSC072D12]OFQ34005.1 major capsid protein [Corynebacterium sp. HMSC072D12]